MLKRDLEAIWGENPETVFTLNNGDQYRKHWKPIFVRILKKKGSGYVLEYLTHRIGEHRWDTHRSDENHATSCKRIERNYEKYKEYTWESLKELLTVEAQAKWREEQIKLQVKPDAIAKILSLTDLSERDLQQTPEEVLLALVDALKK